MRKQKFLLVYRIAGLFAVIVIIMLFPRDGEAVGNTGAKRFPDRHSAVIIGTSSVPGLSANNPLSQHQKQSGQPHKDTTRAESMFLKMYAALHGYYLHTSKEYMVIMLLLMVFLVVTGVLPHLSVPWSKQLDLIMTVLASLCFVAALSHHIGTFQIRGDYRGYYAGACAIREGIPLDNKQAISELVAGSMEKFPPLNYPPFWYVIMVPFSMFSLKTFYILLTISNYLILVILFIIGSSCLLTFRLSLALWFSLATLIILSYPVRWTIYEGQVNLLLSLLLLLFIYFVSHGKSRIAGVSLGLAIAIKIIPIVLFLPLFCRREWRVLKWSSAVVMCSLLFSACITGPGYLYRYVADGIFYKGTGLLTFDMKQSVVSVLARMPIHCHFTGQFRWQIIGFIISLLCVMFSVGITLKHRKTADTVGMTPISQELLYSYWLLIMLLCSPHTLFHHLAMMLPVLFVLTDELVRRRLYLLSVIALFFWSLANHDYAFSHAYYPHPMPLGILTANSFFWGLVGLASLMLLLLLSRKSAGALKST